MKTLRRMAIVAVLAAAALVVGATLYGRNEGQRLEFQGWVEAQLIFVSPDEIGRIEKLAVREGDEVKEGALLFALDADLQRAAVAENEAAVTNARQAYDRAKALLKGAVGTQKAFEEAEAALRTAEARLNSAKTRLERRRVSSPVTGTVQEVYFRVGEQVQPGRPILSLLPPAPGRVRSVCEPCARPGQCHTTPGRRNRAAPAPAFAALAAPPTAAPAHRGGHFRWRWRSGSPTVAARSNHRRQRR